MSIQEPTADLPTCCGAEPTPLSLDQATEQATVFKVLADPVRLRLLALIAVNSTDGVCVCDLVAAFELTQPTISHHLKVLRKAGLVGSKRRGTWVYYWINPDALASAQRSLDALNTVAAPA